LKLYPLKTLEQHDSLFLEKLLWPIKKELKYITLSIFVQVFLRAFTIL